MRSTNLFLWILLFFSFLIEGLAQSPVQYATAVITEPSSTKQPTIRYVLETGLADTIHLQKYRSSEARGAGAESIQETSLKNQQRITAFLNEMADEGYHIHTMSYEVDDHSGKHSYYTFKKMVGIPMNSKSVDKASGNSSNDQLDLILKQDTIVFDKKNTLEDFIKLINVENGVLKLRELPGGILAYTSAIKSNKFENDPGVIPLGSYSLTMQYGFKSKKVKTIKKTIRIK